MQALDAFDIISLPTIDYLVFQYHNVIIKVKLRKRLPAVHIVININDAILKKIIKVGGIHYSTKQPFIKDIDFKQPAFY